MREVVRMMVERKISKGEIVIKQGDPGDYVFVVESGELECECEVTLQIHFSIRFQVQNPNF
jgi:hypothetical protein